MSTAGAAGCDIILYHLSRNYVACRYIIVTVGREISPNDPEHPDTLKNDRFVAYRAGVVSGKSTTT